jgi:ATP-dependent Lon protease
MRDFRDAKTMAQTLRESLTVKAVTISHSESLELVSRMLGVADWNTLSAVLLADRRGSASPAAGPTGATASYPALPLRDFVPFPTTSFPLFVGREKTIQALDRAFERQREVVLAVQKRAGVDEPGFDDVYEVGVLARLLELQRLDDRTLKVLVQAHRRVTICRFIGETGAFQAEVADISEGPIPDAPFLIKQAVTRFESYAADRAIQLRQMWPPLDQIHDPGRVADIIASYLPLPIGDKQNLLATLDPVSRLEKVDALLNNIENASPLPPAVAEMIPEIRYSAELETTLHRAFACANQRRHEYATLEHLLLALIDDATASAAMRSCKVDLDVMRTKLVSYLDNELTRLVIAKGDDAKPTAAFQRVIQRAARVAQESNRPISTGIDILWAIFSETQSPAARLFGEQGVEPAALLSLPGFGKDRMR